MSAKTWGHALSKLDALWTRVDVRLSVWVLIVEMVSIAVWVVLKGLSAGGALSSGRAFRAVVTSALLGALVHAAVRKRVAPRVHGGAVAAAMTVGLFLGRLWAHVGVDYASNILNWLQNASTLMLIGGLRGLVTRLTLLVALLGGAIATAGGKHINIDVAIRYLPRRFAEITTLVFWFVASLVCLLGAWGFVDSIAVTKYGAEARVACGEGKICDTPVSERFSALAKGARQDLFLLGRQLSLDLRTLPRVARGEAYDKYMSNAEWNEWLTSRRSDWENQFGPDAVRPLVFDAADSSARRTPAVVAPGVGVRGLLSRELNFIFPIGLISIGLRFLLRILLVLTGRASVEAAHGEGEPVTGEVPSA